MSRVTVGKKTTLVGVRQISRLFFFLNLKIYKQGSWNQIAYAYRNKVINEFYNVHVNE